MATDWILHLLHLFRMDDTTVSLFPACSSQSGRTIQDKDLSKHGRVVPSTKF